MILNSHYYVENASEMIAKKIMVTTAVSKDNVRT